MKRVIILLLGTLILSGCSIKMAYNNLDRLVRWGVSDYVDLNAEQRKLLQREIDQVHRWHRQNHLPQYAEFAYAFSKVVGDGVSEARLNMVFEQFEVWFDEVESQATPAVIAVMQTLTDEQVAILPAKLSASNTELAEPEQDKSLAEAQTLWAEEYAEVLKNFIGRLNKEQRAYLARRSLEYQPERVLWAEYRQRFQTALIEVLDARHSEQFPTAYRDLVAARESYYGDELTAVFEHNRQLNQDAASHLLSNLTPRQSQRFVERLTDLGDDFAELAAES
ncbi:MAG: DUF6279 family lipoprotein [Pseudomonadota bacterium]